MQKVRMNSIASVLGFGLAAILISGCSTTKQIEVSTTPVERPALKLPAADTINIKRVEWIIITEENYNEVFSKIRASGRPIALFAVTDEGYENISLNYSSIRAYIQQQQAIILAYKNYYEESQEALDKADESLDNIKQDVESQQKAESSSFWNIFK